MLSHLLPFTHRPYRPSRVLLSRSRAPSRREERLRDLELGGADARTLRDIVTAGGSTTQTFDYSLGARGYDTVPVTLTVPDVLVGEMVFAPFEGEAREAPRLVSPLQAQN